jgi:hypothetical protein
VRRRRGRRRKKLLDDLKERMGYPHLKEEALDCTMWRNGFGRGVVPVVRQITERMKLEWSASKSRFEPYLSKYKRTIPVTGNQFDRRFLQISPSDSLLWTAGQTSFMCHTCTSVLHVGKIQQLKQTNCVFTEHYFFLICRRQPRGLPR